MVRRIQVTQADLENAIICYSRCLWCGRRTPHDLCHAHAPSCGGSMDGPEWTQYDAEPETCTGPACPAEK